MEFINYIKNNLNKCAVYLTILILILIVLLLIINNNSNHQQIKEELIILNEKEFNINIHYPILKDRKLSKKIYNFINNEINSFNNELTYLEKDKNYELYIDYNVTDNIKNLYSIHFILYKFTGGAHHFRKDIIYYYDYKQKKEVKLDDIFLNLDNALQKLSVTSNAKLILNHKDYLLPYESYSKGLEPRPDNFKYILFDTDIIYLIFPPYQVSPWSTGEITLDINYNEINPYLKKDYRKNVDNKKINSKKENTRKLRDVNPLKDKKLIALTFDDGPSKKVTDKLLEGLKERDAKVTFFILGNKIKQMSDTILKLYNEGHTIGSHTYNHKNLLNLNEQQILNEINNTNMELEKITGSKPTFLRPPYGLFNDRIQSLTDMTLVLWNVDSKDWSLKSTNRIYKRIVKNAKDGNIILLHDLYESSVKAVFKAIDELVKEGYAFVSLEELERMGFIKPNEKYMYSFVRN